MMAGIKFEVVKKIADTKFMIRKMRNISKLDSVSPPSVFVGSKLKYPLVNIGILSPLQREEDAWVYDNESYWAKNDFSIKDVVQLRESLLNSRFQSQVQDSRMNKRFVNLAQEIAIASKPVDVEIELKRKFDFRRKNDRVLTPHGMKAPLKKAKITGNVKVHRKVDSVVNDELKAAEGIEILYKSNFSEYTLNKILSVGVLGLKKNKKFVPTRWSITATDDTIGKHVLKRVRDYKWIEDYGIFFGEFMGNQYLIMFFPDVFNYELFELYYPGSSWNPTKVLKASTDYETFSGRKTYASNTVGGYYATRLPILEYLDSIKRQASILVIRLETPSYWASLGVWVVRESVRKAIARGMMKFGSKEELLEGLKKIAKVKYDFDPNEILEKSRLLNQINTQQKLGSWF